MPAFDVPEIPQPRVSPELLMGAASPLWGYFGAAAASGMAYWWMTRAFQPVNLEAFFNAATRLAEPMAEPVLVAAQATAEVVAEEPVTLIAAAQDLAEPAAPARVAEAAEPTAEIAPEVAPESAPSEPATLAAPDAEPMAEPTDATGKPRVRKAAPPPTPQA